MHSLQEITDAWGNWMLSQVGGGSVRFTSTTNYGQHRELNAYHQYQCSATYRSISYSEPITSDGDMVVPSQTLTNYTDIQQTQGFSWNKATTDTFSWSITEALKVGVTVTGSAGVPLVAEGKVSATVELNLSSTQTTTESTTQTWSVNQPVLVPAHTWVKCESVISTNTDSIPFFATAQVQGYVAIWFENKVNGHWLWFYPIGGVLQDVISHKTIDTTGYGVLDYQTISASVSGTCNGAFGVNIITTYTSGPLDTDTKELKADGQETSREYVGAIAAPVPDDATDAALS